MQKAADAGSVPFGRVVQLVGVLVSTINFIQFLSAGSTVMEILFASVCWKYKSINC